MADEVMRAPALGGVTERLDAQGAHGADDDGVPITRSEGEGAKQLTCIYYIYHFLRTSDSQTSQISDYSDSSVLENSDSRDSDLR